jgi:phosphomannomutase
MNLRASSTEPLLRLNLETRGDPVLLEETTKEIRAMIEG